MAGFRGPGRGRQVVPPIREAGNVPRPPLHTAQATGLPGSRCPEK